MSSTSGIISSSHHQFWVSTACPLHSTHFSYSSAEGSVGNGLLLLLHTHLPAPGRTTPHQAPTLVGAPGQTWPLHPPIVEGYVLRCGPGCSLVGPCSAFCSTPGTSSSIGPSFGKGHGCQGSPWWWTNSATLSSLLKPWWLSRTSSGLLSLWQAGLWPKCLLSLPVGLCFTSGGQLPLTVHTLSAPGSFSKRTLCPSLTHLPILVHIAKTWATFSVCRPDNRDLGSLPYWLDGRDSACRSKCGRPCQWPQWIICSASLLPEWVACRNISCRIRGWCSPSAFQCRYSSRNMSTSMQCSISQIDRLSMFAHSLAARVLPLLSL